MEYLFIAVFSQALVILFLFKDDLIKKGAEKFLWFFIINTSCILLLKFSFLIFKEHKLYTSYSPSTSLISPVLIYFYIKSTLTGKIVSRKTQFLHYLPAILFSVAFATIGLAVIFYKNYNWITPYKQCYDVVFFIVSFVYHAISIYLLFLSKKEKWLSTSILMWFIGFLLLFLGKISQITFVINIALITSLFGFVYFLIFFLKQKYFSKNQLFTKKSELSISKTEIPKYEKSTLKKEQKEEILKTLEKYMADEKPYLNPNLSLTELSNLLKVSKHNITEVLNIDLEKNFFQYINEYRIKEAKKRMIEYKNDNLLLIAHFSGFKSKTTFIKYFKEIVGTTPSEYRKQQSL